MTHICVGNLTIIGSDNGLSPGRHQAIIWTNAGILLIRHLGTNFSEISIEIHILSFTKMHLKMSSGKWRPFCLVLNVLNTYIVAMRSHDHTRPLWCLMIHWTLTSSSHHEACWLYVWRGCFFLPRWLITATDVTSVAEYDAGGKHVCHIHHDKFVD